MAEIRTADFEYDLPSELVAFWPAKRREEARLMVLDRRAQSITHAGFKDIVGFLRSGDLVVVNDTRVIRARLAGEKPTGGAVELLLLREVEPGLWEALVKPSRRLHAGTVVDLGGGPRCVVEERREGAKRTVRFDTEDVLGLLDRSGKIPLPPYIKREPEPMDEERYQTVYAARDGSVAAPTAGLHFSRELLGEIAGRGVGLAVITLHVGRGSFVPVKAADPSKHVLDPEYFEIPAATVTAINEARARRARIVAVGTTCVRALETAASSSGKIAPLAGWTDKLILPPYRFRMVDALVTNFHLPRSTLLMLVCAFAGRGFVMRAYREAVRLKYRFYSYGDAMMIT